MRFGYTYVYRIVDEQILSMYTRQTIRCPLTKSMGVDGVSDQTNWTC